MKKHIVCILFFLFTGFVFGQEQENNYKALKFKNLSLKEGLSQSSVLSILQDKKGFLWFGTRDGLNKYDGNEFKIFRHNSQDSTSLSNNFIRSLLEDSKGSLWIGTIDGLNKFSPETNAFKRYFFEVKNRGSEHFEIWNIVEDNDGFLWLGTSLGLKKFNIKKDEFEEYPFEQSKKNIFNTPTRALLLTDDYQLWIKSTEYIGLYDLKTKKAKQYSYPENSEDKLNSSYVSELYQDKNKNVWLCLDYGLALLNKKTDTFEFFKIESKKERIIDENVRSICEDYTGNLWVGTYNGLYLFNPNRTKISHFLHDENDPNSLSQNSVYKIYQDIKGDMWIGTYAGGVNYFDRSYDIFKHFSTGTNNTKLNYKVVSAFVEDFNNNLWVGTEGGGINVYNKKTGTFKYYTNDSNSPNSLSANNVKTIIQDHAGNFWIGTHNGGLNFLNPNKQPFKFIKFKNNVNNESSLSNNRVISLHEDSQNNIWIGTSGGGLNVLNSATNSITRIADTQELLGDLIHVVSRTSEKNNLLIGGNKGLAKINIETEQLVPINYLGKNNVQVSNAVLSIFVDKNKDLWIGTEGDGLYYYNTKTQTAKNYNTSNGLPNDIIYGIVPDNNNNLWLSTNYGLSRINLQSFKIKNFNESDGLQSNEFNYGAYLKNKKGELLFGGTNGFNVFNPNDIVENTFVPPVTITSFKVNNMPNLIVTDSTERITLKHKQNVFNFDFVALSYSQPNKNQYAYKLEGFDKDWNYIGNKKSATYTNLDEGDYVFKVKASNNDALWNEKGAALPITILPAPWRTWWAYLIYILLLSALVLLIRKYSLIRMRERNELKHERLEKRKIAEVNKMKLELFTNVSHDFRTPLTLIIGPLERMMQEEKVSEFVKDQHKIMHRNAKILLQLINQLLDFRKSQSGKLELKASKNNIIPFVENIKLSFDELARARNIDYSFTASNTNIEVWFDKINLKKVVFNLLSNAFKFTSDNGKISILISTETHKEKKGSSKDFLKLMVEDNGKGVPEKNIKFIFDRFYQLDQKENTRSGTGIGLALTKNLIKLHKGLIKVKSQEGKGTSFIVLLPLGNSHLHENQIIDISEENSNNQSFISNTSDFLIKESFNVDLENENDEKEADKNNGKPTLLIVEDNIEVRKFIKEILKKKYVILEAENGKKALEITKNNKVDLIISDLMMPEMDGMELCDTIKSNISTSHIPVILLTAKTSEDSQKEGYKTGADAYILKPFDSNVLEIRVNNLIKARKVLIEKYRKDIILQPKKPNAESADELFLQKAITLIEENMLNSEFTIQDFISEMGMSRSALYRKLKALSNQSITEFIRTIKLKRAKQLILNTQLNISEIAFDLGFNDLKYFRKTFKALFNELPSQCRSKNTSSITSEDVDS